MTLMLPEVTLACVDTREPALALRALRHSMAQARFGDVVLFTDPSRLAQAPPDLRVVAAQVDSIEAYSHFMLRGLAAHVHTSHVLVVQWDGFVTRARAWDARFLDCDYIGARWHDRPRAQSVGNGGFSLRSRRLLLALQDPALRETHPEDLCICADNRALLERAHGIRIAPPELAERFAYERLAPGGETFGFHGLFNFPRELAPDELSAFIRTMPDRLARSLDAHDLCRQLIAGGALDDAAELLAKRARLGMRDRRTWRLRAHWLWRRAAQRLRGAGR
jgi:hypothetical protein